MVDSKTLIETAVKLERLQQQKLRDALSRKNEHLKSYINNTEAYTIELDIAPVFEFAKKEFKMPYEVEMGFMEEGSYSPNPLKIQPVFFPAEELIKAKDTFFFENEDEAWYYIYYDHNNGFAKKVDGVLVKPASSVKDRVGKISKVSVADKSKGKLVAYGIITNQDAAMAVDNGVIKKVSVRVIPRKISFENGKKVGRDIVFQEISLVSNDAYKGSYIKGV